MDGPLRLHVSKRNLMNSLNSLTGLRWQISNVDLGVALVNLCQCFYCRIMPHFLLARISDIPVFI